MEILCLFVVVIDHRIIGIDDVVVSARSRSALSTCARLSGIEALPHVRPGLSGMCARLLIQLRRYLVEFGDQCVRLYFYIIGIVRLESRAVSAINPLL